MGMALLAGPANVIMELARPGVGHGVALGDHQHEVLLEQLAGHEVASAHRARRCVEQGDEHRA